MVWAIFLLFFTADTDKSLIQVKMSRQVQKCGAQGELEARDINLEGISI